MDKPTSNPEQPNRKSPDPQAVIKEYDTKEKEVVGLLEQTTDENLRTELLGILNEIRVQRANVQASLQQLKGDMEGALETKITALETSNQKMREEMGRTALIDPKLQLALVEGEFRLKEMRRELITIKKLRAEERENSANINELKQETEKIYEALRSNAARGQALEFLTKPDYAALSARSNTANAARKELMNAAGSSTDETVKALAKEADAAWSRYEQGLENTNGTYTFSNDPAKLANVFAGLNILDDVVARYGEFKNGKKVEVKTPVAEPAKQVETKPVQEEKKPEAKPAPAKTETPPAKKPEAPVQQPAPKAIPSRQTEAIPAQSIDAVRNGNSIRVPRNVAMRITVAPAGTIANTYSFESNTLASPFSQMVKLNGKLEETFRDIVVDSGFTGKVTVEMNGRASSFDFSQNVPVSKPEVSQTPKAEVTPPKQNPVVEQVAPKSAPTAPEKTVKQPVKAAEQIPKKSAVRVTEVGELSADLPAEIREYKPATEHARAVHASFNGAYKDMLARYAGDDRVRFALIDAWSAALVPVEKEPSGMMSIMQDMMGDAVDAAQQNEALAGAYINNRYTANMTNEQLEQKVLEDAAKQEFPVLTPRQLSAATWLAVHTEEVLGPDGVTEDDFGPGGRVSEKMQSVFLDCMEVMSQVGDKKMLRDIGNRSMRMINPSMKEGMEAENFRWILNSQRMDGPVRGTPPGLTFEKISRGIVQMDAGTFRTRGGTQEIKLGYFDGPVGFQQKKIYATYRLTPDTPAISDQSIDATYDAAQDVWVISVKRLDIPNHYLYSSAQRVGERIDDPYNPPKPGAAVEKKQPETPVQKTVEPIVPATPVAKPETPKAVKQEEVPKTAKQVEAPQKKVETPNKKVEKPLQEKIDVAVTPDNMINAMFDRPAERTALFARIKEAYGRYSNVLMQERETYGGNPLWEAYHQEARQLIDESYEQAPGGRFPTDIARRTAMVRKIEELEKTLNEYDSVKRTWEKIPEKQEPVWTPERVDRKAWKARAEKDVQRYNELTAKYEKSSKPEVAALYKQFNKTVWQSWEAYKSEANKPNPDLAFIDAALGQIERIYFYYETALAQADGTDKTEVQPVSVSLFDSLKKRVTNGMMSIGAEKIGVKMLFNKDQSRMDIRKGMMSNANLRPMREMTDDEVRALIYLKAHIGDIAGNDGQINAGDVNAIADGIMRDIMSRPYDLYQRILKERNMNPNSKDARGLRMALNIEGLTQKEASDLNYGRSVMRRPLMRFFARMFAPDQLNKLAAAENDLRRVAQARGQIPSEVRGEIMKELSTFLAQSHQNPRLEGPVDTGHKLISEYAMGEFQKYASVVKGMGERSTKDISDATGATLSSYAPDGFSSAIIDWMLDANARPEGRAGTPPGSALWIEKK